jgi:tetratricopeptide (TPR) repeat protein
MVLVGRPKKKLVVWGLAGGGVAVAAVVAAVIAMGGGAPTATPRPTPPAPPMAAADPKPTPQPPAPVARTTPDKPEAAREPVAPSTEPTEPVAAVPSSRPKRIGGRRVVLEYDKPAATAPAVVEEDPALVEKARDIYLQGNSKLFSGDAAGAVTAYQKALQIYPGYVAGYRGLGLAYAQQGQTKEAISALKTYLKTVPTAKDVPLLKRRLDALERQR